MPLLDGISPQIVVNTCRRANNEICSTVTCLLHIALAAKVLGSSLLASRRRSAVSPKVASSGMEISKHFLPLVADNFTFSLPRG